MTFLPIVDRELQVAARKRSTFWLRVTSALVALLIAATFFILSYSPQSAMSPLSLGSGMFGVLTWLSLAVALSCGLFFTSDCLSEEKREGTLGLLFLTDLRGRDVVLGKLLATSLRGFYALLAVLPIVGITLLMGGVTGTQFWQTSLALVSAMLISLSAGMFVSAISLESQKAMLGTLLLLFLLVAVGPAIDQFIAWFEKRPAFNAFLSYTSPVYLFTASGNMVRGVFWWSLLVNQAVALGLWVLTGLMLPRLWQEKGPRMSTVGRWHRWKFRQGPRRLRFRQKLLEVNPVMWLSCREQWQTIAFWAVSILAIVAILVFARFGQEGVWMAGLYLGRLVTLVLYLGVASQATRFFVEARRNGMVELLLVSPLAVPRIVQGFLRGMARKFGPPLLLYLGLQVIVGVLAYQVMWGTTVVGAAVNPMTSPVLMGLAVSFSALLMVVFNMVALTWVGMWMGTTSKNMTWATCKTFVFVQVVPWMVISVGTALMLPLLANSGRQIGISGSFVIWWPLISGVSVMVLHAIKDVLFVVWARRRLYRDFRRLAI